MKEHIPEDKIEEIRNRADIVSLVSGYLTLKKAGRNFTGLCPFHKEKNPSFTVNPDKQIFYCFGCGEGGNVFTFLMKIDNMSFPEAVRHLAGKMGIVIGSRHMGGAEKKEISIREELKRVNLLAAQYFSKNLFSEAGSVVRGYLEKRGIKDPVVKEFNLGYSMDGWEYLKRFLKERNINLGLVEKAGLIIPKSNGGFYDRFRGRLIFPIEDISGNVVAFGGRVLGSGEPKYLNSPESPIYVKGKILYGLNRSKNDVRKKDYAILVEGYLDLLSLRSFGISNVVATLGTAVTKEHVALIRRYTKNLVVMFDPDEGGKNALERSLKLFLEGNLNTRIVVLPDGYDPDEYVRSFGIEALEKAVDHSQSMVDYYIEKIIGGRETFEESLDSVMDAVLFISNIGDTIQRNLFVRRVSEKSGIDQSLLKREINRKLSSRKATGEDLSGKKKNKDVDVIELGLIHMMLEYPLKVPEIIDGKVLNYFMSDDLKRLGNVLGQSCGRNGKLNVSAVVDGLEDGVVKERLLKLTMTESPYGAEVIDKIFADSVKRIKQKWYRGKRKSLNRELVKAQETNDQKTWNILLMEKEKLLKEEKELL
ncbi:MAG: DNA primase [Syntrophales bacterium]|nr:DNA primase [Syntrophales bacterium]